MSQNWWRVRYYRFEYWMMPVKNCLFLLWAQELFKKIELFLFDYCWSGSVLRSCLCEVTGRFLMYFNKVRILFSMLGSCGPCAGSYMAQICKKCFLWIIPLLHKPKQLSAARSVFVQSNDNQFLLISCHPGKPPKPSGMCFLQRWHSSLSKPC